MQILDQNPVASRLCLLDSILNRLIQALSHLEMLQLCRCMLSNLLLEEELKLVEDVDRVGDEEEDRRRGRRLLVGLLDQELDAVLCRLSSRWRVLLGIVLGAIVTASGETLSHLVPPPGQRAVRVNEVRQDVELEAEIVEVIHCADNLVQGLLHQVRPYASLHGELTLALEDEFSEYDRFTLRLRLPLHVCEPIIFAKLILLGRLVDQVASHLLKLIVHLCLILVVVFVAVVRVVGCRLLRFFRRV